MRFQPLDKLINLHDGYRRRFKVDSLDVLVIQEADAVYIVDSRCPHRGHPLQDADIEAGVLFCPMHNFGFHLDSGEHIDRACPALRVYTPHFEANEIGIVVHD